MNLPKTLSEKLFASIEEILKLPKSAIYILQVLSKEKEATIEKLMELANISRRTAHECLKKMRDYGLVKRKASEIEGRLKYVYFLAPLPEIIEVLRKTLQRKLKNLEELQKRLGDEQNE